MSQLNDAYYDVPVVALRGVVVFPNMILHFDVGRTKSIQSLKYAMEHEQQVFLVAQKVMTCNEPIQKDLYRFGVMATVKQMIKIPNSDTMRVVVEGQHRASLISMVEEKPFLQGTILDCHDAQISTYYKGLTNGYIRVAKAKYEAYARFSTHANRDIGMKIIGETDCGALADLIASNTKMPYTIQQTILAELHPVKRLMILCAELEKEIYTLKIESEIQDKLQEQIDHNQREYYLREELKVISDELGDSENLSAEVEQYLNVICALDVTNDVKEKLQKECERLLKMPAGSHEATVVRTYIDTCLEIPFGVVTKERILLSAAQKILDKDHFGLDKVKTRILESLAVRKLSPDIAGQILCLVGPPGVGKTSIVQSLAKAMGRKYVRISLGGIRDESDIRGHRKTYIGAMTGRMIAALKSAKTMNPIILLDEIDKLGSDGHGDPASALLEALDPEQNSGFTDHYIDFPVNFSKVMFITTANDLSTIPAPLRDRMEVIELYSYTFSEKMNIAKKHLVKAQILRHGLTVRNTKITDEALAMLIDAYTKEAGVRELQRVIASVCRKAAAFIAEDESRKFVLTKDKIEPLLGAAKFKNDTVSTIDEVGVVNGLAWTRVGGTMLPIEISAFPGTGKLKLTGNLGDVMQESAETAVSYVRSRAGQLGIDHEFYKTRDIHIHAPESAIPKDGPSAGIAITTALVSELTGYPIDCQVAMTGEISLKGKVLPIGGLKEKSMAAYRTGIKKVIIPYDNLSDLDEIDTVVKEHIEFFPVKVYDQVMELVFHPTHVKEGKMKSIVIHKDVKSTRVIAQ